MGENKKIRIESRIMKDGREYCFCELEGAKRVTPLENIAAHLKAKGEDNNFDAVLSADGRVVRRGGTEIPYSVLPDKERLIVQELRDFVDNDADYSIALVSGIRQTGKTTALMQLLISYPGSVYINLAAEGVDFETVESKFLENPTKLLLLDEITHLSDFEQEAQLLFNLAVDKGFKIIVTGSSPAHIVKLWRSSVGGGRSRLYRLPPVKFVEYLYLTGRIQNYRDYENISNDCFTDYLFLKDLKKLRVQFDGTYFKDYYDVTLTGNKTRYLSHSLVGLNANDLTNMCNLLAYKLNEACSYDNAVSPDKPGKAEHNNVPAEIRAGTPKYRDIDLSDAILCDSIAGAAPMSAEDKGRILSFFLWSGLACVEYRKIGAQQTLTDIGTIVWGLEKCKNDTELRKLFDEVSICLTTPLFYTRLGADFLRLMNFDIEYLCHSKGYLLGKMLEVYLRGAVAMLYEQTILTSIKLDYIGSPQNESGEVDIYASELGLMCESSKGNKGRGGEKPVSIPKYMKDIDLIRVCSSADRTETISGVHHIPYAKLCCMVDTGDILAIERTKGYGFLDSNT